MDIKVHPILEPLLDELVKIREEQVRLRALLPVDVYKRVTEIVEREPMHMKAAYYGAIADAAKSGYIYAGVQTIEEIVYMYLRPMVDQIVKEREEEGLAPLYDDEDLSADEADHQRAISFQIDCLWRDYNELLERPHSIERAKALLEEIDNLEANLFKSED